MAETLLSLSLVCVKTVEEETEINSSLTTLVGLAAEDGSHASGKKKTKKKTAHTKKSMLPEAKRQP